MRDRVVVVGGNAAGMSVAGRAKRLDRELRLLVLEAGPFISYSICGTPFFVAGEVESHQDLISFNPQTLAQERGIEARTGVRVEEILPGRRRLRCRDQEREFIEPYDRLVLATGYRPLRPRLPGLELENVFTVSRLEDGEAVREALRRGAKRAVIVGGGYIGLMMADALGSSGLDVTLIERRPHVFSQVDDDMAESIESELERQGVALMTQASVEELLGRGRVEAVQVEERRIEADLVLIDVGVEPNVDLAQAAGVSLGRSGAVQCDRRGQTEQPGTWAAGNCAETRHLITGRPLFSALGTTAAQQGRVVGENLAGRRAEYPGCLETSVEKVFSRAVARTGLTLRQAHEAGFEADAVTVSSRDRAGYLKESGQMKVRLVFDKPRGRLLGGQLVGPHQTAKRIDALVTALSAGMDVERFSKLDWSYAPSFSTLWDPFQVAANLALRRL